MTKRLELYTRAGGPGTQVARAICGRASKAAASASLHPKTRSARAAVATGGIGRRFPGVSQLSRKGPSRWWLSRRRIGPIPQRVARFRPQAGRTDASASTVDCCMIKRSLLHNEMGAPPAGPHPCFHLLTAPRSFRDVRGGEGGSGRRRGRFGCATGLGGAEPEPAAAACSGRTLKLPPIQRGAEEQD